MGYWNSGLLLCSSMAIVKLLRPYVKKQLHWTILFFHGNRRKSVLWLETPICLHKIGIWLEKEKIQKVHRKSLIKTHALFLLLSNTLHCSASWFSPLLSSAHFSLIKIPQYRIPISGVLLWKGTWGERERERFSSSLNSQTVWAIVKDCYRSHQEICFVQGIHSEKPHQNPSRKSILSDKLLKGDLRGKIIGAIFCCC